MGTILLVWLPLCIAVGMFASIRRNRSGFGWFLFSFFLSPFLGIIFVAILKEKQSPVRVTGQQPAGFFEDLAS
jgi:hypothetical protein